MTHPSTFHRRLIVDHALLGVRLLRGDATTTTFRGNGVDVFSPDSTTNDRLYKDGIGYRFIDSEAGAIEIYDSIGAIRERWLMNGQFLRFIYSDEGTSVTMAPGPGYLIGVTDGFDRSIAFEYYASNGRVSKVISPDGQFIQFDYLNQNLSKIHWQDLLWREFLYENSRFSWALTGVVSENRLRLSTFSYDTNGRALSTERAGGNERFGSNYDVAPIISVDDTYDSQANIVRRRLSWRVANSLSISQPNGSSLTIGVGIVAGNPVTVTRSQPAGSGCAASSRFSTYDTNGNIASEDDFDGARMCAVSDLRRNLRTVNVEGLPNTHACSSVTAAASVLPAGSRKTSTQWHPDWRLPIKTAQAGRMTTSVYNGQPDPFNANAVANCAPASALLPDGKPIVVLCKQVEQSTTDVDGALGFGASIQTAVAPRVQSWTYNVWGQMLTHDGPRTDIADITNYSYYNDTTAEHTQGDLQSVTNPLGQVTRYTRYDRNGRLPQMQAANGTFTDLSYDQRGRLRTVTVAGLTTQYDYTPTGQLLRVTQPDGSWLLHEYDPAQRLVAMSNQLGHRIQYTLDSAGNRVEEDVRDGTGTRRRTIARSVDALNRVYQIIGKE